MPTLRPLSSEHSVHATFCTQEWFRQHINMKMHQVVAMYLDTDEIVRLAPPDVSALNIFFLLLPFLGTHGHYSIRKYSCWYKAFSLVFGCGHVAKSRGPYLDVSGRLRLKLTGRKTGSLCFR
jgi:hypothetical protein